MLCLLALFVSCSVALQGIVTYELALGYIQYKPEYLNGEFQRLLGTKEPTIRAVERWQQGEARAPVHFATALLLLAHAVVNVAAVLLLWRHAPGMRAWMAAAAAFAVATLASEWLLMKPLWRDGRG